LPLRGMVRAMEAIAPATADGHRTNRPRVGVAAASSHVNTGGRRGRAACGRRPTPKRRAARRTTVSPKQAAASSGAAASAGDSDEEGTAPARPEKAARLVERPAVEGPTRPAHGPTKVIAESADPPGRCGLGAVWEAQLVRLAAYKEAHADCNVPKRWAEDPPLGWADNQAAEVQEGDGPRRPQLADDGATGGEAGGVGLRLGASKRWCLRPP
jgi:hypothetical protein